MSLQYLKENVMVEANFLPADKQQRLFQTFLKLILANHAQDTLNNNCAISLQYVKKELSDKVDFLHADKHGSLLLQFR